MSLEGLRAFCASLWPIDSSQVNLVFQGTSLFRDSRPFIACLAIALATADSFAVPATQGWVFVLFSDPNIWSLIIRNKAIDAFNHAGKKFARPSFSASATASSAVRATWMPGSGSPSRQTAQVWSPMIGTFSRRAKEISERVP